MLWILQAALLSLLWAAADAACSILGTCGTCTSLGPTCGWRKTTGDCIGGSQDQSDDGTAYRVRSEWAYRYWLGESLCSKWWVYNTVRQPGLSFDGPFSSSFARFAALSSLHSL